MENKASNKRFYIILGISFLIMVLFGKLPPFGAMTPYGMQFLGVFLGCIFGWLFNEIITVSMLGIVVSGILISGQTVDKMMISLQSANMVLVVFWAFFFVYALKRCGLMDYLSNKIMSMRFCTKSPWHLAIAIWVCAMVCAGISTQPFATAIVMFSMFYSVAEKAGAQKASNYTTYVLVGMACMCSLSTGMVPYAGVIFTSFTFMSAAVPDAVLNIPMICVVNFCVVLMTLILLAIVLKILMITKVIVPEFSTDNVDQLFQNSAKMDAKVKWGFFYIVLLVVLMLLPSFLPKTSAPYLFLQHIGTLGMFVVVVTLMSFTTINGERFLDVEVAIKEGAVSWSVYFMMGAALVISGQLVTEDAGLAITLQQALGGIVGNLSVYGLCLVFITLGFILTNCITNTVAMQLIIPVLAVFMVAKGANPVVITGLSGIILVYGQVLPSGSPLGAFLHGNVEWVEAKKCYIYAICCAICVIISVAVVGIPLALFLS